MRATEILHQKMILKHESGNRLAVFEFVAWQIPRSKDYPTGVKFRAFLSENGEALWGFDNHKPKGPRLHVRDKEVGYVLRRLIRRLILLAKEGAEIKKLFSVIYEKYKEFYPNLDNISVNAVFFEERGKFEETLEKGIGEMNKMDAINAKSAFKLYENHGIPFEVIKDFGGEKAENLTRESFDEEFKKHQEISRDGAEKKFGGHGLILDTGELKAADEEELKKVTRLHTATHLLQASLRKVLGEGIRQAGSDVTSERTRFDFTFERKLTDDELKKIEDLVNGAIKEKLPMQFQEMQIEEAKKTGALFFFKEKYPASVKVYYAGTSLQNAFSKEFCGGPHVQNTSEIGKFKILKQEPLGSGLRRIRATVE